MGWISSPFLFTGIHVFIGMSDNFSPGFQKFNGLFFLILFSKMPGNQGRFLAANKLRQLLQ